MSKNNISVQPLQKKTVIIYNNSPELIYNETNMVLKPPNGILPHKKAVVELLGVRSNIRIKNTGKSTGTNLPASTILKSPDFTHISFNELSDGCIITYNGLKPSYTITHPKSQPTDQKSKSKSKFGATSSNTYLLVILVLFALWYLCKKKTNGTLFGKRIRR